MSTDLLIIDVQDYFDTAAAVVDETVREIKLARRRKATIVVAEYGPVRRCGHSSQKVLDALKGYDKVMVVTKHTDGGGEDVMKAYNKNGLQPTKFRVVGVNRSYCVRDTIVDILNIFKKNKKKIKIEVSENGTNCYSRDRGLVWLAQLGCDII